MHLWSEEVHVIMYLQAKYVLFEICSMYVKQIPA